MRPSLLSLLILHGRSDSIVPSCTRSLACSSAGTYDLVVIKLRASTHTPTQAAASTTMALQPMLLLVRSGRAATACCRCRSAPLLLRQSVSHPHTRQQQQRARYYHDSSSSSSSSCTEPLDPVARRLKGLAFEAQVADLLRTFQCDLRATQMSNDGGIDHQVRLTVAYTQHSAWPMPSFSLSHSHSRDPGHLATARLGH